MRNLGKSLLTPVLLLTLLVASPPAFAQSTGEATPATEEQEKPRPAEIFPVPEGKQLQKIELPLEEAVRIALQRNLDIRVEALSRKRVLSDVVIASAVFDPLFSTTYTMSKFRTPTVDFLSGVGSVSTVAVNPFTNQNFGAGISGLLHTGTTYSLRVSDNRGDNPESGFFGFNPRNDTNVRLTVTQPFLKGFGFNNNLADVRIARNSSEISEHRLRRLLETTVADVTNAFWNLVHARENLRVKREGLREAEQLLEINRSKVAVGTAKEIDIVDAEANIETQKSDIIEVENILRKAQDSLLDLMNYKEVRREEGKTESRFGPLYDDLEIIPATSLTFEEFPTVLEDAIQLALDQRHDLRELYLVRENARLERLRRKNELLPTLNVLGTWNQDGLEENIGNSIDGIGSGRFYNWTVGITVEYPLGNRQEKNRFMQSEFDLEAATLSYDRLRDTIVLEVTQVVRDIESTFQRVQTTLAANRLRAEQLEAEKQRLRVGSSTSYQVLQIQNDLLEAETEQIRALVDFRQAITAFKKTVGTILE